MTYAYRSRLTAFTLRIICAVLLFSACSSTRDYKAWKAPEVTLMKIDSIVMLKSRQVIFRDWLLGLLQEEEKSGARGMAMQTWNPE